MARAGRWTAFGAALAVWIFVCFVSTRFLPWLLPAEESSRPAGEKFMEFLAQWSNPDVILLGSSLFLVPSARTDTFFDHKMQRSDAFYYCDELPNYGKADYFTYLLRQKTGRSPTVANLALTGAMVSDDYMVLQKILKRGCHPKLIICGLAPRDFVSNDSGAGSDSFLYKAFKLLKEHYPEMHLLNWRGSALAALRIAQARFYFNVRCRNACKVLHSLFDAAFLNKPFTVQTNVSDGNFAPCYETKANSLGGLDLYKNRYNPPNFSQCTEQLSYLERLLALCTQEGIAVMLVDMPLPPENLALLDPALLKQYRHGLAAAAAKYHAYLLDLNKVNFVLSDFEDACHLNASGGGKLFRILAASCAQSIPNWQNASQRFSSER